MSIPNLFEDRRRFAGMLALAAAGAVLAVSYFAHPIDNSPGGGHTPTHQQQPYPATPTGSPSGLPTRLVSPREAATEATREYIVAFFDHTGTDVEWHAAIDAHSTQTLASLNDTVPRSEVPNVRLRSLRVTGLRPTYAELQARMSDGMVLFVAAVLDSDEWRVNEFAPEPQ